MKYYFVGINGTGMSALAKLLKDQGNEVVGSDVVEHYFTEDSLIEKGLRLISINICIIMISLVKCLIKKQ